MNPAKCSVRAALYLFAAAVMIVGIAAPSFAYEEDTHFLMTYVICRSAGFTEREALIVAAVDQGMDDSKATNAHDGAKPQVLEEWMWHALDKDGKMHASGILARRDALFNDAVNERDPRNRLIRLGIFFHFQQDTWAHRYHEKPNHLSHTGYTTFNTPTGHSPWGSQPDRPPLDPVAAVMCLEQGIGYAADFVRRGLGREPNAFFNGYKPAGGKEDTAWKDKKKGKFFNQIDISGISAASARLFLNSLVRAQIDAYPATPSPNPFYAPRNTADNVDFDQVRSALQSVCGRFGSLVGTIVIPSRQDKIAQGFTDLTTPGLLALIPGGK
jgi:hypothetical protein